MTEDYKSKLLKYLTGNLEEQSGNYIPYYLDFDNKQDSTLDDFMKTKFEGMYWFNGNVKCKDGKGNYNGKVLYWGVGYELEETDIPTNFLLLVDDNINPISLITNYSSGTSFNTFSVLNVAEDGNVYGIDSYWDEEYNGYRFRILLLNNISEVPKGYSTYTCILRNSYFIQGYTSEDDLNPDQPCFIQKSPQSATYYYSIADSTGVNYNPGTFKINVGSANEWVKMPSILLYEGGVKRCNIYFDKDDVVNTNYYCTEMVGNDRILEQIKTTGTNEPVYNRLLEEIEPLIFDFTAQKKWYYPDLAVAEDGTLYLILSGYYSVNGTNYFQLVKVYRYINNFELLMTKESDFPTTKDELANIDWNLSDNNLFMYIFFLDQDGTNYNIWFSMVNPKNDLNITKDTGITFLSGESKINLLNNAFNLYNYGIYYKKDDNDYKLNTKLIYNVNNYNGSSYENDNSLIGKQGVIYNSENKPIFARNLYNYKVYNNRTISTLNVPYNMLNDIEMYSNTLLSETNSNIINNSQSITKNIYEDLYINYFITLNMENRNEDIYINNSSGAINLSKSAFKTGDYNNGKGTKLIVTYKDGFTLETQCVATISNNVATYELILFIQPGKEVSKIDIVSNDGDVVYQTITNEVINKMNLQPNKYYKISQDVHIE